MYLLYLDDAGSPENVNEEYYVLGGVCVYEAQVHWFTGELDKLACNFDAAHPESIEFHASEIFARRRAPWKKLQSKEEASGVLKSVLRTIHSSFNSTRLFACAIEKSAFPERNLVEMAFEDLCKRFDSFLTRQRQGGSQERGLLILDEMKDELALRRLSREFRVGGTRWGAIRNLVETPLFVDSRASRLVQIADHVAYSVFRRYNAADAQYFDIVAGRFDESDGVVHGLSHKHSAYASCMCPACLSRRLRAVPLD